MADQLAVWLRPLCLPRTNIKRGQAEEVSRYVNKSDFFWNMTPCNVVAIYSIHIWEGFTASLFTVKDFLSTLKRAKQFSSKLGKICTTLYGITYHNANLGQNLSTSPGKL
jgi:hypothetical protein